MTITIEAGRLSHFLDTIQGLTARGLGFTATLDPTGVWFTITLTGAY